MTLFEGLLILMLLRGRDRNKLKNENAFSCNSFREMIESKFHQ